MICKLCGQEATRPNFGQEVDYPKYFAVCNKCWLNQIRATARYFRFQSETLAKQSAIVENDLRNAKLGPSSPTDPSIGMNADARAGYIHNCLYSGESISHEDNNWLAYYKGTAL